MELHVNDEAFADSPSELLARALEVAAEHDGRDGEVAVTLVDDAEITRLNREYLGKDRPTDVIAFDLGQDGVPMGDVYIGYEQAARQAQDHGVPLREELARLTIHGALHVFGHDHPDGDERLSSPMFEVQERLLRIVLDAEA